MNDRILSLDVYRGMTIAGMVLVNNPGGSPVYWALEHAEWNGLTPTDWIFPFFLFIVGVSIAISLGKRPVITNRRTYLKIVSRALWIYGLGAALSIVPFFQFQASDAPDSIKLFVWILFCAALFFLLLSNYKIAAALCVAGLLGIALMNLAGWNIVGYNYATLRIMGVLQRIALVYLITAILFLYLDWKKLLGVSVALLLIYWALIRLIPVPGCDVTTMNDKACNLAAYLDRLVLTEDHIWRGGKVYDPEGLLSTIPAIVTCISGVLTGLWLRSNDEPRIAEANDRPISGNSFSSLNKVAGMFFFGTVSLAVGLIWNSYFPMNKALWTSSYVLATTGIALLIFGGCYWLIDIKGYAKWAWPFKVFGANALALFVFSGFMARMLSAYRVSGPEGPPISLGRWTMNNIFLPIWNPIDASLAYAITFILVWLFLMWMLHRKSIYIKV